MTKSRVSQEEAEKDPIRKAKPYTSEDLHKMLFPDGPPPRASLEDLKEGIRKYVREKHQRLNEESPKETNNTE